MNDLQIFAILVVVCVVGLVFLFVRQQKRLFRLEKTVAELTVLILTNPKTDQKLVEHFNADRIKNANHTAKPINSGWKPNHW